MDDNGEHDQVPTDGPDRDTTGTPTRAHDRTLGSTPDTDPRARKAAPEEGDPPGHAIMTAIAELDLPEEGKKLERNRVALQAAYNYLCTEGSATRSDFQEDVYPEYPSVYTEPDGEWWREVIHPGLKELPGVTPSKDSDSWTYIGDEQQDQ